MLFKKKEKSLKAYADGRMIPIEDVQDAVFSKKMMGDGVAILPNAGSICAPCDGVVTATFDTTQHAIGITMDNGMELLLHVGLDTVNIKEPIFQTLVKKGDKIVSGQTLIQYDKKQIEALGYQDVTMLVILQGGEGTYQIQQHGQVQKGITNIISYQYV